MSNEDTWSARSRRLLQELSGRLRTSVATSSPRPATTPPTSLRVEDRSEPVMFGVLDLERPLRAGDRVFAVYILANARGTTVPVDTQGTILEVYGGGTSASSRYQVRWDDGGIGSYDPSELKVEGGVAERRVSARSRTSAGAPRAAPASAREPTTRRVPQSRAPSSAATTAVAPPTPAAIVQRIVADLAASSLLGSATIGRIVEEASSHGLSKDDVHRILRALATRNHLQLLPAPMHAAMHDTSWLLDGSLRDHDGTPLVYARSLHRALKHTSYPQYRLVWTTILDHPERSTEPVFGSVGERTYGSVDTSRLENARHLGARMLAGKDDHPSDFVAEVGIAAVTATGAFAGWIQPPEQRTRGGARRDETPRPASTRHTDRNAETLRRDEPPKRLSRIQAAERLGAALRHEGYALAIAWDQQRPRQPILIRADRGTGPSHEIGTIAIHAEGAIALGGDFALYRDRQKAIDALIDRVLAGFEIEPDETGTLRAPGRSLSDHALVHAALLKLASEHPPETLLSVRDLRRRTTLDKDRFDAAALVLMRNGSAVMHHHDHAAALSESERRDLVAEGRGTHYVGIVPRSRSPEGRDARRGGKGA